MCLYPTLIKNRKYIKNKKNGGVVPPYSDKRVLWVPIGCQKCMECRKQKARGWQVRLLEHIKTNTNGKFITLTFSNESIQKLNKKIPQELEGYDRDNAIATLAMRRFLERHRKKYKKPLHHWMVTELGHTGTHHLHIHGIIWTNNYLTTKDGNKQPWQTEIKNLWKYGWIWTGNKRQNGTVENYVNGRTVSYIVKYVNKADEDHPGYKSIILTSKGIGGNYTQRIDSKNNKFNGKKTEERYRTSTGHKIAMPTYWRNKIYSEKERETLWCQRLDKQERWVCQERVDVSKTEKYYYQLLEWHRKRNQRLGYGDNQQTWEQAEYEKNKRNLKILERIKPKQKRSAPLEI